MNFSAFKERYQFNPQKDILEDNYDSIIYKAFDTKYQQIVAIQKMERRHQAEKYSLMSRVKRSKVIHHTNLANYSDCYRFKTVFGIFDYAILDFCKYGQLTNFLTKESTIKEKKQILTGLFNGLVHIHQFGISHLQLHPNYIWLTHENGQWIPKIAHLGFSSDLLNQTPPTLSLHALLPAYAAPEQVIGKLQDINKAADWWTFGVIAYQLFTSELPFGSRKQGDYFKTISTKILQHKLPEKTAKIPQPYQSIVRTCLTKNPVKRMQLIPNIYKHFQAVATPLVHPDKVVLDALERSWQTSGEANGSSPRQDSSSKSNAVSPSIPPVKTPSTPSIANQPVQPLWQDLLQHLFSFFIAAALTTLFIFIGAYLSQEWLVNKGAECADNTLSCTWFIWLAVGILSLGGVWLSRLNPLKAAIATALIYNAHLLFFQIQYPLTSDFKALFGLKHLPNSSDWIDKVLQGNFVVIILLVLSILSISIYSFFQSRKNSISST